MDADKITKNEITYGLQWYKVKSTDSGINKFLEEIRNGNDEMYMVIRHHYAKGRFYGVASKYQMEKMIIKNVYLYEILSPSMKKKVYFDIDSKTDTLQECIKVIKQSFPQCNLQISGVKNPIDKFSYHIVLSNYYTYDTTIIKEFVKKYKDLGFDPCVYNKYNLFKCINQSKPKKDAPIQEWLYGDKKYTKHLVLMDFDDNSQNIEDAALNEIKQSLNELRRPENRNELNETKIELLDINIYDIKYDLPEDFDYINARALDKLNAIPLQARETNNTLNHMVIWKIMVWAKSENIHFNDFWNWCSQKDNSEARKLRYIMYYESSSNYKISEQFIDTLLLKYYPHLKQNNYTNLFKKSNDLTTLPQTVVYEKEYLDYKDISLNKKLSYLSVKMGGNKTGAVIEHIKNHYKEKRVLYITPRVSLSPDLKQRFKNASLDITVYSEIEDSQFMSNENLLIICINSLKRLMGSKYDVIIIDEIETMWENFSENTTKEFKRITSQVWSLFVRLLKDAEKVIVMDALMVMKTINTINKIIQEDFEVITLSYKQEAREYIKYKSKQESLWYDAIIKSLKNNEKIYIFIPYITTKENTKRNPLSGVQSLIDYLCKKFNLIENKDIIGYYSDQKEQKKQLEYIDEIWGNAKCIVANTCISVGNNYTRNDFDKIYVYYASWVNSRELIQSMYRVRRPKENTMHIYFEKAFNTFDRYNHNKVILNEDSYEELQKGLLIERKTPSLDRIKILMERCNITEKQLQPELIQVEKLDLDNFSISYSKIPEMTLDEYLQIKNNLRNGFISLLERLRYEKYILKNNFKHDTPEDVIELFWDTPDLIYKLKELNKNKLIQDILESIGYDDFITFIDKHTSVDVSSLYIPNHITNDTIKKHFDLKNGITQRDAILVSRLINGYFNKRVMYSVKDVNNNYTKIYIKKLDKRIHKYEMDELFCEKVMFYKEYIECDKYLIHKL
jgi:hypothetical protein